MFKDRLDGDRVFARIRSFDCECPRCSEIFHCSGKTKMFDRRVGRFECPSCGLTLQVGVLFYPARPGIAKPASDARPTIQQALALRNQLVGGAHIPTIKAWKDPANIVVREGCRCIVKKRGLVIHPECPIHSPHE